MRGSLSIFALLLAACGGGNPGATPVGEIDTSARNSEGKYISWREHAIDDEASSGIELRGAVALAAGDLNQDGFVDVVSAFRDARFVRVAYGDENPDEWFRLSLAEREEAQGVSDVAIGDVNGDGWPDIVAATEEGPLYLENPAEKKPGFRWGRLMVDAGVGPWTRAALVDLNGDGRLDLLAAGGGSVVWLEVVGDALTVAGWSVHAIGKGSDARAVDFDGDGDLDIFAGSTWFENTGAADAPFSQHPVEIEQQLTGPFALADLSGDGKPDVVTARDSECVWFEQPAEGAWTRHEIGSIAPDIAAGLALADLDGDGDLDLLAGSAGAGPADEDGEDLTATSALGRIAWFQNPGGAGGEWTRHDIVRRKRGAFKAFLPRDMDADGDVDFLGVRDGSGKLDGVFWLQQLHSDEPVVRFQAAREDDSESMPLP